MIKITPGMSRAMMLLKSEKECSNCGIKIPVYPGRYPKICPNCKGDIVNNKGGMDDISTSDAEDCPNVEVEVEVGDMELECDCDKTSCTCDTTYGEDEEEEKEDNIFPNPSRASRLRDMIRVNYPDFNF